MASPRGIDPKFCGDNFFNKIDGDKDGYLVFEDIITLFYIIMSKRPFCNECSKFIYSNYYNCETCFKRKISGNSLRYFIICPKCYRNKSCGHKHGGRVRFVDNCTLLGNLQQNGVRRRLSGLNMQQFLQ